MQIVEIIISLLIAIFGLGVQPAEPAWVECGACGAHVTEWWYVRNDADTEFVEVCSKCHDVVAGQVACDGCGRCIDGFAFGTSEGTFCADCYEG